jgi:hypothetical protein
MLTRTADSVPLLLHCVLQYVLGLPEPETRVSSSGRRVTTYCICVCASEHLLSCSAGSITSGHQSALSVELLYGIVVT